MRERLPFIVHWNEFWTRAIRHSTGLRSYYFHKFAFISISVSATSIDFNMQSTNKRTKPPVTSTDTNIDGYTNTDINIDVQMRMEPDSRRSRKIFSDQCKWFMALMFYLCVYLICVCVCQSFILIILSLNRYSCPSIYLTVLLYPSMLSPSSF